MQFTPDNHFHRTAVRRALGRTHTESAGRFSQQHTQQADFVQQSIFLTL